MVNKEILAFAAKVIRDEAEALIRLSGSLDSRFSNLVTRIHESNGKLVITGVGKSALVGRKMAATLNSIGTSTVFMHATDALHGDLGILEEQDLVLFLSKSGNTPEIQILVPQIRILGNPILAIVSDPDSYLEKQAEITVRIPVPSEASQNHLMPTTSTTLQMAAGDALAMCLVELKGFSSDDFGRLHPGGSIGKRLFLRVSDLYPRNERPVVEKSAPVRTVIMEMTSKRLGATAVADPNGSVIGIITDGDLRRMMERFEDTRGLTAESIMSPNPRQITPEQPAARALEIMRANSITQLLVIENNNYLGVIHIHDIIREGIV